MKHIPLIIGATIFVVFFLVLHVIVRVLAVGAWIAVVTSAGYYGLITNLDRKIEDVVTAICNRVDDSLGG